MDDGTGQQCAQAEKEDTVEGKACFQPRRGTN